MPVLPYMLQRAQLDGQPVLVGLPVPIHDLQPIAAREQVAIIQRIPPQGRPPVTLTRRQPFRPPQPVLHLLSACFTIPFSPRSPTFAALLPSPSHARVRGTLLNCCSAAVSSVTNPATRSPCGV